MVDFPLINIIIAVGVVVLLSIFFHFVPFFLWLSAKVSGVKVSLIQLFLMRIRNVPPSVIVPSLIEAHKAGLGYITRDNLEAHFMTLFTLWCQLLKPISTFLLRKLRRST